MQPLKLCGSSWVILLMDQQQTYNIIIIVKHRLVRLYIKRHISTSVLVDLCKQINLWWQKLKRKKIRLTIVLQSHCIVGIC